MRVVILWYKKERERENRASKKKEEGSWAREGFRRHLRQSDEREVIPIISTIFC